MPHLARFLLPLVSVGAGYAAVGCGRAEGLRCYVRPMGDNPFAVPLTTLEKSWVPATGQLAEVGDAHRCPDSTFSVFPVLAGEADGE